MFPNCLCKTLNELSFDTLYPLGGLSNQKRLKQTSGPQHLSKWQLTANFCSQWLRQQKQGIFGTLFWPVRHGLSSEKSAEGRARE
jgi:hypothetical protein